MAAGKSTVGRSLAQRLNVPFIDIDDEIAARHGTIEAIFADEGEACFRAYEFAAISRALSNKPPSVIALGGGALIHDRTRHGVRERGVRVFLDVPFPTLQRRLTQTPSRPVVATAASADALEALYLRRRPEYLRAEVVVDAGSLSPTATVDYIVERLSELSAAKP